MEHKARITLVGGLIKVIDQAGVETARTPVNSMHLVPLLQQQLRQIAAVLPGDAVDQGGFERE